MPFNFYKAVLILVNSRKAENGTLLATTYEKKFKVGIKCGHHSKCSTRVKANSPNVYQLPPSGNGAILTTFAEKKIKVRIEVSVN